MGEALPYYLSFPESDWRWLCEATQDDPADSPIRRDMHAMWPASYPKGNHEMKLTTPEAMSRFRELWIEHVT